MKSSLLHDDHPLLPIPAQRHWGENYAVTFFDPSSGIGGMIMLGRLVVRNELWRSLVFINFPNDRILISKNFGRSVDPKIPSSGVLDFEVLEVGKRFSIRFDGLMDDRTMTELNTLGLQIGDNLPVRFELVFESDAPVWDMHAKPEELDSLEDDSVNFSSPDGHTEQNGRLSGRIIVGEDDAETYLIDAVSTRDHSRGPRNVAPFKADIWAHGVFPSGRSFNLWTFKAHSMPGTVANGAVAIVDGVLHHLSFRADCDAWLETPEQLFKPLTLPFDSETLGPIEIHATRLINSVPLLLMPPAEHFWSVPRQSRHKKIAWVNEQKVEWRWDGERGYGHMERGNTRIHCADPAWLANFGTP